MKDIFENESVNEMSSFLSGMFYQCWEEFEPPAKDIVKNLKSDLTAEGKGTFIDAVTQILAFIENKPEVKNIFFKIGSNYDPREDSISFLEWLIIIKLYLKTNDGNILNAIYSDSTHR